MRVLFLVFLCRMERLLIKDCFLFIFPSDTLPCIHPRTHRTHAQILSLQQSQLAASAAHTAAAAAADASHAELTRQLSVAHSETSRANDAVKQREEELAVMRARVSELNAESAMRLRQCEDANEAVCGGLHACLLLR
jgi:hypothetical protein